jgi:fatty-acid desaturase
MSTTLRPKREKRVIHRRPKPAPAAVTSEQPAPVAPTKGETLQQIYDSFAPSNLTWKQVDWIVVLWIGAMHVGALAAPFFFTWPALAVCIGLHWMTGSLGICMSYHRFLSHKSMKLRAPARFFGLLCGALSGEGSPLTWAATHRLHHMRSDQEGDPHSPLDGPWWSHMNWLWVYRTPEQRDRLFKRFAPDLMHDRMMLFFEKTYGLWLIASGIGLYAWGGLPFLVWGLCVRMVFMYHSTWFVNSATHLWGYRNYETKDESRNLWWVAVLAYGEGWHNNHHAHPHTARAGHRWWELDPTFWAIRTLQLVGLAYNVDDRTPAMNEQAFDEDAAAAA